MSEYYVCSVITEATRWHQAASNPLGLESHGGELQYGCLELNPSALKEQPVLITTEPGILGDEILFINYKSYYFLEESHPSALCTSDNMKFHLGQTGNPSLQKADPGGLPQVGG